VGTARRLVTRRGLAHGGPYLAAVAFYATFIARNAFLLEGRRAFGLSDDAMISMTYARNLAEGHGLVWNPGGPREEGFTNPLWTLLMAVPHALGLPDRLAALPILVLGGALLVACAAIARSLAARVSPERPLAAAMAPWLVAFCYPLVYWTLRGFEVGLVTLLVLAGALLCLRLADGERRAGPLLAATVSVGIFTRLDVWVFVPVFCGFLVLRDAAPRRALLPVVVAAVLTTMILEVARLGYYGEPFPNTYTLKVEGVGLATRLGRGLSSLGFVAAAELAAVLVTAAVAVWTRRRQEGTLLLAALFVAGAAYSTFVGGDAWEWMCIPNRFLVPGVVALLCLAPAGALDLAHRLARPEARATRLLLLGALGAVSLCVSFEHIPGREIAFMDEAPTAVTALDAAPLPFALALSVLPWLGVAGAARPRAAVLLTAGLLFQVSGPAAMFWAAHGAVHTRDDAAMARYGRLVASVSTEATVAVVWAGSLVYFSRLPAIDLLGRSDERIARLPPRPDMPFWPGHSKWDYDLSVLHDRPDLVLQLWKPTHTEVERILCGGYVAVRPGPEVVSRFGLHTAPDLFARADSIRVDWSAFERLPRVCAGDGAGG